MELQHMPHGPEKIYRPFSLGKTRTGGKYLTVQPSSRTRAQGLPILSSMR
jgi:hypothetical protein